MIIMKKIKILMTLILTTLVVSCAGPSFNNKIQSDKYDLLTDESFMRYNSNRLAAMESPTLFL